MIDRNLTRQVNSLSALVGGLGSDAVVSRQAYPRPGQQRPGAPVAITGFLLAPGSWILAGQASFSVAGSDSEELEYRLSLVYRQGSRPAGRRGAYMRLRGGEFGSPVVVDAMTFDRLTSVTLVYETQGGRAPRNTATQGGGIPGADLRDQCLLALRVSGLLVI